MINIHFHPTMSLCSMVNTIERHNPYLAPPGHIRDLILKWCTHPYPPVDVQRLAASIRIHPDVRSGVLELYFKSWFDRKNIKSLIVNGFRRLRVQVPNAVLCYTDHLQLYKHLRQHTVGLLVTISSVTTPIRTPFFSPVYVKRVSNYQTCARA
jgi:hypothetical protein